MQSARGWAEAEFGDAQLGDSRRTRALVRIATEVASHPAGTVTRACSSSASKEAAFRLLENPAVRPEAVSKAVVGASARRCAGHATVVVPVDATTLTLTDTKRSKGLGSIGARDKGARGLHVMSALAVALDGTTLGICAQQTWIRKTRSKHGECRRASPTRKSETQHWLDVLQSTHAALARSAPQCRPWFQLDRGGDCWQVLTTARQLDLQLTVRATHDRRTDDDAGHLWAALERAPVIATRRVFVHARPKRQRNKRVGERRRVRIDLPARKARLAKVRVRAAKVPLLLSSQPGRAFPLEIHAVLVTEVDGPARDRIEWMLLTTHPIATRADVLEVVRCYCLRWRIEDFHRVWKRGLCRVEDTQLRSRDAIWKWATLLATVATRAMRLTQLARTTPDVPATTELTSVELEALIALRVPKGFKTGEIPTLAQAVRWIADLGGYIGPWNGPPGATIIGRGLHDVIVTARAFENRDKKR